MGLVDRGRPLRLSRRPRNVRTALRQTGARDWRRSHLRCAPIDNSQPVKLIASVVRLSRRVHLGSSSSAPSRATLSLRCLSCREIGAERRFFPSIKVLAQEFELAARCLQSHAPQYQPQRRVARLHHFDHCLRGANRIPWLLAAATRNCLPARTCSFGVIFDSVAGLLQGAPSPIRAERPRLHDHHLDPERLNLLRQCFRETFDGKLGRVIVARTREPDEW
jgi:hypothetical protein